MKTVIVVSGWQGGGTERYVQLLAQAHRRANWTPHLIVETAIGSKNTNIEPFESAVELRRPIDTSPELLIEQCIRLGAKVIHINAWNRWFRCHRELARHHLAVLQTYHATLPPVTPIKVKDLLHPGRARNKLRMRFAQLIPDAPLVCISRSNFERISAIERFTSEKALIYNGIHGGRVPSAGSKPKEKKIRLIWAGALIPRKDPILAIDVATRLSEIQNASVEITLAGTGPLMHQCTNRARNAGTNLAIVMAGRVDDVVRLSASADAMLITSKDEGIPYVAIEALSVGTPIVSTRCGAISEALTDGAGIIAESRDARELAEQVLEAVGTQSTHFRANAAKLFIEKFEFNGFADRTVAFTLDVCEPRPRVGPV